MGAWGYRHLMTRSVAQLHGQVLAFLAAWDRDIPDGCVLSFVASIPSLGAETTVAVQMRVHSATGSLAEIAQLTAFNMSA